VLKDRALAYARLSVGMPIISMIYRAGAIESGLLSEFFSRS
jgi:hypothetical protein